MTREEWKARKRLKRRAVRKRLQFEGHESRRITHIATAQRLAEECGRVPTLKEIATAVGEHCPGMIRYWGYDFRKVGQQTGRQASEHLYKAAGLEKRAVGYDGHINPRKRKLTPA